jgi:hypothetical protein
MQQTGSSNPDADNAPPVDAVSLGYQWSGVWPASAPLTPSAALAPAANRLECFFADRKTGRGIWKWRHYFEMYDRHFRRFCNTEVHILEIGVYSGGSLEMWQDYFGPRARIYGVDLAPECKAYESPSVRIFTGDQADRAFWHNFRQQVPVLDIVIDDGGHQPTQQVISLEELLPHLRQGGVYLCEDVVSTGMHPFASYVHGLAHRLNDFTGVVGNEADAERRLVCPPTALQRAIASVHLYPFVAVVERNPVPIAEFVAPKHGSEWQPFLR